MNIEDIPFFIALHMLDQTTYASFVAMSFFFSVDLICYPLFLGG